MRIGHSYDLHRLATGHPLFLGGIEIEHELGLVGHSDADVLLHVITEALIGAMGLGDIGDHFPDTDPSLKGVDSKVLLAQIVELLAENQYEIINLDTTIHAQKPKLGPHKQTMKIRIAELLRIDVSQVNVKATTGEKIGIIGREEGIAAEAVVLIKKKWGKNENSKCNWRGLGRLWSSLEFSKQWNNR
ncbi:MAG: 2-C-methyl-D-erythritol 2,4-cyclodiphosphate synthase [Mycoplasmatales bacterium]